MSQFRTTADIMDLALTNAGEVTNGNSPYETDLLNKLNRVHFSLLAGGTIALGPDATVEIDEVWPWARSRYPINIELLPAITTGTVTLTNGAEAFSFSSAPSVSVAGWYLKIEGIEGLWRIGTHSANSTSAELECHWPKDSQTGVNFSVFKLDYEIIPDHIVIDSGNNKINFKTTSAGSELTSTLTTGVYTPAQLATHIGTQMTATAAGPTITGSYSSLNKLFTLASDGAGTTTIIPLFATGTNQKQSVHKTLGFDDEDLSAGTTQTGVYILGGISRLVGPIRISDGSEKLVQGIDKESFIREYTPDVITEGVPDKFCVFYEKDDGTHFVRFNKYPSESVRAIIDHIPIPRDLKDNAGSIPLVPRKFIDILEDAATFYIMLLKHDSRAAEYAGLVKGKLQAMVNQHRGSLLRTGDSFGRLYPRRDNMLQGRKIFGGDPYV
jgi:hypothetical protein